MTMCVPIHVIQALSICTGIRIKVVDHRDGAGEISAASELEAQVYCGLENLP